jgi:hypothetical protein
VIWLTLLPWSLWNTCGWGLVLICSIISFLLLGIDEIGVSIEEPFSLTNLQSLVRAVFVGASGVGQCSALPTCPGTGHAPKAATLALSPLPCVFGCTQCEGVERDMEEMGKMHDGTGQNGSGPVAAVDIVVAAACAAGERAAARAFAG